MEGSLIRVFPKNIITLKNSKPHFCFIMTLLFGTEKEIEINFTNFFIVMTWNLPLLPSQFTAFLRKNNEFMLMVVCYVATHFKRVLNAIFTLVFFWQKTQFNRNHPLLQQSQPSGAIRRGVICSFRELVFVCDGTELGKFYKSQDGVFWYNFQIFQQTKSQVTREYNFPI